MLPETLEDELVVAVEVRPERLAQMTARGPRS
jgi:hypothetical protein